MIFFLRAKIDIKNCFKNSIQKIKGNQFSGLYDNVLEHDLQYYADLFIEKCNDLFENLDDINAEYHDTT